MKYEKLWRVVEQMLVVLLKVRAAVLRSRFNMVASAVLAGCLAFIAGVAVLVVAVLFVWATFAGQNWTTLALEQVIPDRSRFPYSYNTLGKMRSYAMREPPQDFARSEVEEITRAARGLVTLPARTSMSEVPPAELAALTLRKMRQRNFVYTQQNPTAAGDGREYNSNDELLASTERVLQWEGQHRDLNAIFPTLFSQRRTRFMMSTMSPTLMDAVESEIRSRQVEFDVCIDAARDVKGYDLENCFPDVKSVRPR